MVSAAKYLDIFKMADPQNPDCCYLTAVFEIKKGDKPKAIAALNQAAALGYSDVIQLTTDPVFGPILLDPGFVKVVNDVRANIFK